MFILLTKIVIFTNCTQKKVNMLFWLCCAHANIF